MRYIKEPEVVEAVIWDGKSVSETPDWLVEALGNNIITRLGDEVIVETYDGRVKASPGDYIIKDSKGSIYVRSSRAFQDKYKAGDDIGEVSDGFHTFNELYEYRMLYNAAFFNKLTASGVKVCKSRKHSDGQECFGGGWFVVMAELPTGQVSNHYQDKDWHLFKVLELERAWEYDGHTSEEAAGRLLGYILDDPEPVTFPRYGNARDKGRAISLAIEAMRPMGVNSWTPCGCYPDNDPQKAHEDNMRFCEEFNKLQTKMLIELAHNINNFLKE